MNDGRSRFDTSTAAGLRNARMEEAAWRWKAYAMQRGFLFDEPIVIGGPDEKPPCVDGTVHGVAVSLQLGLGAESTLVLAAQPGIVRGAVEVKSRSALDALSSLFGAEDVPLGDAPFEAAYRVHASPAETARIILTATTRAEMLALGARSFLYDDGASRGHTPLVRMQLDGIRHAPEVLDRALALVAAVTLARAPEQPYR
jgi:hypothetical protein